MLTAARVQKFVGMDTTKIRKYTAVPEEHEGNDEGDPPREREEMECAYPLATGGLCDYKGTRQAVITHQRIVPKAIHRLRGLVQTNQYTLCRHGYGNKGGAQRHVVKVWLKRTCQGQTR